MLKIKKSFIKEEVRITVDQRRGPIPLDLPHKEDVNIFVFPIFLSFGC